MENVNRRNKVLKNKFKISKVKQLLKDSKVISYLNILQEQYFMCPIDKAENKLYLNVTNIMSKYS